MVVPTVIFRMSKLPQNPSESVKARNPHLFSKMTTAKDKMLRQDSKPKLNKTEARLGEYLGMRFPDSSIYAQEITFKLANGVRYTPDFILISPLSATIDAYECKGFMRDDAAVKIKVAAAKYPNICWRLIWIDDGQWREQIILK